MPKQKPEPYNHITAKEIEDWTSSFDKLLNSERGRDMFREFLLHQGNESNLEFWEDCQKMKQKYQELRDDANNIFDTYLDITAPKKVNVYMEAEEVRKKLEDRKWENFEVFDTAMYKVKSRMEQDSYPEFCQELIKMKKSLK